MIMKAEVSSKAHPEYGQATIPLPIPDSQYDSVIDLLEAMDIGSPTAQDCRVDGLDTEYPILNRLVAQSVNVDELDFVGASFISLASASGESSLISLLRLSKSKPLHWVSIWLPLKRLDSFCAGEKEKFQAMASKLCLSDIKDFINLTFCCQQATSSEQVPYPSLPPPAKARSFHCSSSPNRTRFAGLRFGFPLHQNEAKPAGTGVVTPYGVVYDNGMELEQLYDGRHFPAYCHKPATMVVGINSRPEGAATGYLYLPCPDKQIQRTLERAGIGPEGYRMEITMGELPPQVSAVVSVTRDGLDDLNALCRAIEPLDTEQREKLGAAVLLAQPTYASEVRQLAENLDQFDFVPKPSNPDADCAITDLGYVSYHGSLTLEALMMDDPAEQYRQEQGMGGI